MKPDSADNTQEMNPSTKRRVYELPTELVERIVEFQKDRGLPSEVEAARRLLDQALKSRDTVESLVGRYLAALGPGVEPGEAAGVVLSGHPLVRRISFEDEGIDFLFQMPNKPVEEVSVKSRSEIYIRPEPGSYGNVTEYHFDETAKPGRRLRLSAPTRDMDDEIPF
ncbi:hypothetical protein LCM08_20720 [Salipiger pacificus]|nr:hypothetical protein [Alloyangia pacifica]